MVLLDHLWDDTVTGRSLNKVVYTKPFNIKDIRVEGSSKYQKSLSMPMPSPTAVTKENVFHPGATKTVGANPTVYDWLYSGETRSNNHEKV